ncbi:hypothetical protein J5N97_004984 [Dioscorea zingiberensis]|uniref:Protein kinase domain-containing protein n=1 Tax=Dioscorea zingiberensis TaxID=325984 RepID=A0A9D5HRU0_9LILI|nr:hypothetical protein J5N97_004984 [Dioscorea zingiberensis]
MIFVAAMKSSAITCCQYGEEQVEYLLNNHDCHSQMGANRGGIFACNCDTHCFMEPVEMELSGKVYKGVLSNGWHVAVKHIIKDGYVETFMREVTSLSYVRHRNLVSLREAIVKKQKNVFLFMSFARMAICLSGYLPTNILLGQDFEAKLSDFGLSKVIDNGLSHVSSEVRGTFGYVDPEYRQNRHVNAAGDVYSFGIVLLQILSGMRVLNLNVIKPMSLGKMAKHILKGGNITEFADPKLNVEYSKEAFEMVLKLALSCTSHKQQRPSMEQVITRLEKALDVSVRESTMHRISIASDHPLVGKTRYS